MRVGWSAIFSITVYPPRAARWILSLPRFRTILWSAIGDYPAFFEARFLTEFSPMQPQLQPEPLPQQPQIPEWSPALSIAFRFSVAYLGLFCVATQIITSLFSATQGADIPDPGTLWPLRPLVSWTAAHIFHVSAPLSFEGNSASGDCMFAWVLAFCLLVIAAIPHRHLVLSGPQPEKLCRAANL